MAIAAILFGVCNFDSNSRAETKNATPEIGEKGQCPSDKILQTYRGGGDGDTSLFDEDALPEASFIIAPKKFFMRRFPRPAAKKVKGLKSLHLDLERVEIFGLDLKTKHLLVRVAGAGICGWYPIRMNALLDWNREGKIVAKQQGEAPGKYRVAGSPITLKAVVHNLHVAGDKVPIFKRPLRLPKDAAKLCQDNPNYVALARCLKQFEFLDVFDVKDDPATKREPRKDIKKYFFLVGRSAVAGRAPDILGWAHEDHITIWPTRVAAFWTGKGGALYNDNDLSGSPIMHAPEGTPDKEGQISRRYPILDSHPTSEKITKMIRKGQIKPPTFKNILKIIDAFKIVVPGRACTEGSRKNDCFSAGEFEKLQQEYIAKLNNLKNIDIVFLIDATTSMAPYFDSVAKGVSYFVSNLDPEEDFGLNVSVALYGDYRGQKTGARYVEYERLVPRHDPREDDYSIEILRERASANRTMRDTHRDILEAPFAAILRTLSDETRWRKEEGFRYLVHIADHGNREPGEGRTRADGSVMSSGLEETVTRADVARALIEKAVIYVPIAVPGKPVPAAKVRFRDQSKAILQDLEAKNLARPIAVIKTGPAETAGEVERALTDAIKVKEEALEQLAQHAACYEKTGIQDPQTCARQLKEGRGFIGRIATGQLDRAGLTAEVIANIKDRTQTTMPGWAPPMDGDEQLLTYWLMLKPRRAEMLWLIVKEQCHLFRPGNVTQAVNKLEQSLEKAAMIVSGELDQDRDKDDGTAGDLTKRAFFIPGWALSEVFGKPWSKLRRYVERLTPEGAKRWNKHFCRKAFLLDKAIDQAKKVDEDLIEARWDEEEKRYVFSVPPGGEKRFKWKYEFGNEQNFYFIPFDFIP